MASTRSARFCSEHLGSPDVKAQLHLHQMEGILSELQVPEGITIPLTAVGCVFQNQPRLMICLLSLELDMASCNLVIVI